MASVGLFGGTFNPPHLGHLVMASEAADQLGLDRVVWIPVHTPPHKEVRTDPGAEVRLELVELAIGSDPRFSADRMEIDRGGPSYTVDTLRTVHEVSPEDELTFIVGGDVAHGLPTWHLPAEVLTLARLAVAERDGRRRQDVLERVREVPGGAERVAFFDMPRIDISSTEIRRRIAEGRTIRHLVPDAVVDRLTQQQHDVP